MHEAAYADMAALQQEHWWYRGRRSIISAVIDRLALPASARILEAGTGPGGNLQMLARFGEISGFEPHDGARAHANSLGITDVQFGALPAPIPFPAHFDLVCAFDVIEHVADDHGALVALAACCRPGGRVFITVPAYPWMWSEHDVRNHHQRRYTAASLRRLIAGCGLHIEHLTSFNTLLFPVIAGVRLVQKGLGLGAKAEEAMPSPLANRVLETLFAAEAPLAAGPGLPFGVSLMAVLRSPERAP